MSLETVIAKRAGALTTIGKAALNVKYPDEFELYVIGLELTDSLGKTLRYFIFPVMPSSLDESKPYISNIKKTQGGVSVLTSNQFSPVDINISGSFGRKFRVLLGGDYKDFISSFKDESGGFSKSSFKKGIKEFFDQRVKTGYGSCKIMENIIEETKELDTFGKPKILIFHNLALGNSYIVRPLTLRFSQSQESNMIWNYNLNLKGVGKLNSFFLNRTEQSKRLVISGFAQKRVDNLLNTLTSF